MSATTITLLGTRSSGKSTWLGAFIDALDRSEALRFDLALRQDDDARTRMQLSQPLSDGRFADRTPDTGAHAKVRLVPQGTWTTQREVSLETADYLGEEFERSFERKDGFWTRDWSQRANARAFALVLRPNDLVALPQIPPPSAEELRRVRALFGEKAIEPSVRTLPFGPEDVAPQLAESQQPVELAPRTLPPTLPTLIEMLQFVRAHRGLSIGERPDLRLALVLSAWDAVEASVQSLGPERFLREKLPLLADFILSNFDPAQTRCFGLSATGGALRDESYAEMFRDRDGPLGYVEWSTSADETKRDSDISLPFAWLIAGDSALEPPER